MFREAGRRATLNRALQGPQLNSGGGEAASAAKAYDAQARKAEKRQRPGGGLRDGDDADVVEARVSWVDAFGVCGFCEGKGV